jgi:hypothetical protein
VWWLVVVLFVAVAPFLPHKYINKLSAIIFNKMNSNDRLPLPLLYVRIFRNPRDGRLLVQPQRERCDADGRFRNNIHVVPLCMFIHRKKYVFIITGSENYGE